MGEITEKLACKTEPLVNLKRAVYGGVIYEAFPADCRAWFLRQKKKGGGGCQEETPAEKKNVTSLRGARVDH
jgi:hypothetical protein